MIRYIRVTNYLGESIELHLDKPHASGFAIRGINGLGPPKAEISQMKLATYDGSIVSLTRASARNILIYISFMDSHNIEDLRHVSYKYFPIKKPITIDVFSDNRSSRIEGYVESNDVNIFSKLESTSISIICPDPYFRSLENGGSTITTFHGVERMLEFPVSNESLTNDLIIMGEIHSEVINDIEYFGDVATGITISLSFIGNATNVTIFNTGKREIMFIDTNKIATLTGTPIGSGDEIIICTIPGKKSIRLLRDGLFTNIINCLSLDVDWFQLDKGINTFAYTAEDGVENILFSVENYTFFEGA